MKLGRITLAAALCGALLTAGWAGHAAVNHAVQQAATTAEPITASVRFVTYNTGAHVEVSDAVADIERLAARGADVLALQEMGSAMRRSAVRASLVNCSMCPYEAYMPQPAVPGSTPILYRWEKFRLEGTGTKQVSEDTYVGPRGAGPSTLRAKYVNWVKLRERATGRAVYVLNNHTVPTVQAKDGSANEDYPERLALYRKHMDGLKALIAEFKATGATVFVTGDLNVNYRKDKVVRDPLFPFANLGQLNMQASYAALGDPVRGTHVLENGFDLRVIDYVYYLRHNAVTPVAQRVLIGFHSDHRPVVVDFSLTSAQ